MVPRRVQSQTDQFLSQSPFPVRLTGIIYQPTHEMSFFFFSLQKVNSGARRTETSPETKISITCYMVLARLSRMHREFEKKRPIVYYCHQVCFRHSCFNFGPLVWHCSLWSGEQQTHTVGERASHLDIYATQPTAIIYDLSLPEIDLLPSSLSLSPSYLRTRGDLKLETSILARSQFHNFCWFFCSSKIDLWQFAPRIEWREA